MGSNPPLFYSNRNKRYDRTQIYNIFRRCKERSGITKPGGVHVFFRHSSATLLLNRGCDLLTVKELLRHRTSKLQKSICTSQIAKSEPNMIGI
ncbi:tyrosine-type recombinase/integrase [Methanothrix soehngenii]|uniref:tyrosine-type recombinase/integrase n=1 Tax=Methanothrix soehngenii TaxID=2223 RepID=UPI000A042D69